jgi:hypothetical protein
VSDPFFSEGIRMMEIDVKVRPVLDPEFVPAVLWNRAYRAACADDPDGDPLGIALARLEYHP